MRISDWSSDVCSSDLEALLVTELRPKSGFYDFDAKYTDGMTDHNCPANISDDITEAYKAIALRAHQLLGCKDTSRSDFRWAGSRVGKEWVRQIRYRVSQQHSKKNKQYNISHVR